MSDIKETSSKGSRFESLQKFICTLTVTTSPGVSVVPYPYLTPRSVWVQSRAETVDGRNTGTPRVEGRDSSELSRTRNPENISTSLRNSSLFDTHINNCIHVGITLFDVVNTRKGQKNKTTPP